MPFSIVRDEIARQAADVVIVPANPALKIDGGAGLAVGKVAGLSQLQSACDKVGGCEVGHAVATPAFDFPAKKIVHAVGPIWDESNEAKAILESTYSNALSLAVDLGAQSIALPLISSGALGCPSEISLHTALAQVKAFLESEPEIEVRIVVFDAPATQAGRALFPGLAQFVDDAYAKEHENLYSWSGQMAGAPAAQRHYSEQPRSEETGILGKIKERVRERKSERAASAPAEKSAAPLPFSADADEIMAPNASWAPMDLESAPAHTLEELLDEIDAPFSTTLLAIIDERGLDDAEVYKRANLSRQHFSKIRSNPEYRPTKRTVLALAVALRLDLDETEDLLQRAGLAFSPASKADLIVKWFIMRNKYDIFEINEALYAYDQPILG